MKGGVNDGEMETKVELCVVELCEMSTSMLRWICKRKHKIRLERYQRRDERDRERYNTDDAFTQ